MVNVWEKNAYAYINFSTLRVRILIIKAFQGKNFVIFNKIYILQNSILKSTANRISLIWMKKPK